MTPHMLFSNLLANGITLKLSADGENLVVPAGSLSAEQRALVLAHKPELVAFLVDSRKTTAQLLAAAMRACDQHHDGPAAREQMRADCLALPVDLRADLLAHFQQTYPESKP